MKTKKVIISLRLSGSSGRDILAGIFLYMRKNPTWHTRLFQMPTDLTPETFRELESEGFNGIIASEPGLEETARLICNSKMPIAFIGDGGPIISRRKNNICHIRNDDLYIGRKGALFLLSLGKRRSYGFVPTTSNQYWSDGRQEGFSSELAARGITTQIFKSPDKAGSPVDLQALAQWLADLPKPCSVMAAWDTRATQVIQACQERRIRIPEQVAIIGVDNDELLDESTTPPLTSIMPNHEALGFVAARELGKMMSHRTSSPFLARPLKLVERESAASTAPAAHLVSRANNYILKNAVKGITVRDVVAHLGVSRRLADLRFQEFSGESINETITNVKLAAVKKMLLTTNRTIHNVSVSCGYENVTYLQALFKRRFGMSMRDFRRASEQKKT